MAAGARTNRGAALVAALVLLVSGCAGGSDDESGGDGKDRAAAAAGAKAAKAYAADLTAWSTRLSRAVATRKTKYYKKRDPIWPDLRDVLAGEPKLPQVKGGGADPAYDAAQEVASRFGPVRAELLALQGADFDLTGTTTDYYGVYIDTWGDLFDIGQAGSDADPDIDALMDRTPAEVRRDELAAVKDYKAKQRKVVARLARYERELGRVEAPGALGRSVRAYALEELEGAQALNQEFLDYLERTPAAQVDVGRYNDRAQFHEIDYDSVPLVPWRTRGTVTRALSGTVATLARQAEAGEVEAAGPYVGDVYRTQLARLAAKRPGNDIKQREWITEQLWLLHRIREIEKTPEEVYEQARAAVTLQDTGQDPRNYYGRMLNAYSASSGYYPGSPQEKAFPEYKKWALEQLAGPAPALLEPSRVKLVSWLGRVPTTGPLFERDAPWRDFQEFSEKIMKRAATLVDQDRTRRAAVVRAVTLTRPDQAPKAARTTPTVPPTATPSGR